MYCKLSTIISNIIKYLYISVFHIGNAEPALCQLDQLLPTQPRASGDYLLSAVQVHTTAHREQHLAAHLLYSEILPGLLNHISSPKNTHTHKLHLLK